MTDNNHPADDLEVPFIFVPHGAPEPSAWMARHPGWIKIPATFVPRSAAGEIGAGDAASVIQVADAIPAPGNPMSPTPGDPARSAARRQFPLPLLMPQLLPQIVLLDILGGLLRSADRGAATLGMPGARAPRSADPGPLEHEHLTPPPLPLPPHTGTPAPAPQRAEPVGGGYTAHPERPTVLGDPAAPAQPLILAGPAVSDQGPTILESRRYEGMEPALQSTTNAARQAAAMADRRLVDQLDDNEWAAHHLIGIADIRSFRRLFEIAAKAGWRADEIANVEPLPTTAQAQQKLHERGMDRPIHRGPHREWPREVRRQLELIEQDMDNSGLSEDSLDYQLRARALIENAQRSLRKRLLDIGVGRLTENDTGSAFV